MQDNWFTKNAPKSGGNWFAQNAPTQDDPSRPAGLPVGETLPGVKPTPLPIGMTSNKPGDSADWRERLYGNDGSELLKTPVRHVKDAVLGLASAALHPIKTASAVAGGEDSRLNPFLIPSGKDAAFHGTMQDAVDAIPIYGPWAKSAEAEAKDKGIVPAALGVGADALSAEALGKVTSTAAKTAGRATGFLNATPESRSLALTRKLVPGSSGDVMLRALKPGVRYGADAIEEIQKTIPDVLEQRPLIGSVKEFSRGLQEAADANQSTYQGRISQYRGGQGTTPRPSAIDGGEIADSQVASVPYLDRVEQPAKVSPGGQFSKPGIMERTREVADNYRRPFTVPELDQIREDANGKLNYFYNKAGGDAAAALKQPETARMKAVGDTARELLYPKIEGDLGLEPGSIADSQRQYGRLVEANDIAGNRAIVTGRHDPIGLSEKIALKGGNPIHTAYDYLLQKGLRRLTDSDALMRSAIDRYQNPDATPIIQSEGPGKRLSERLQLSESALRRLSPFAQYVSRSGQGTGD